MGWFDNIEGLNDTHKEFLTKGNYENMGSFIDAVQKEKETKKASWIDALAPEQKGLVESKGFKEISDFITSYANLEKLKGVPEKQLLKIPEKADDKEGWASVFNKLGRPEKPEGYTIEMPEGVEKDESAIKWAQETFHQLGLSKQQGEEFIKSWNKLAMEKQASMVENQKIEEAKAEKELKTKWGLAFEKNKTIAQNAAKQFGIDEQMMGSLISNMGLTKAMEFFHHLGESVGEANFIGKESAHSGLKSPEAARYEISELMSDLEFGKKLASGDREAMRKWEKLHQMANPDSAA